MPCPYITRQVFLRNVKTILTNQSVINDSIDRKHLDNRNLFTIIASNTY